MMNRAAPLSQENGSTPLRVVHISTSDRRGGSARSASRLHAALQEVGVDSRMLVGWQSPGADGDVQTIARGPWRLADRVWGRAVDAVGLQYLSYPSSAHLIRHPWIAQADVIQLYNTHGGYFSHSILPTLSRATPVVWRLSDMWAMTGHCVYSYGCERWKSGCGHCPILEDYPALPWDTTAFLWQHKRRVYARSQLTIVSPTHWLAGLVAQSPLLNRFPLTVIPNGVDAARFSPRDQQQARQRLQISQDAAVLLVAVPPGAQTRKGSRDLASVMARVQPLVSRPLVMLCAGTHTADPSWPRGVRVQSLGWLTDEQLADAYAAADVVVMPSRADNLPNTLLEAMACARPVATFAVGGIPEAARHLETAFVAPAGDQDALAQGIGMLVRDAALRERLGRCAREVVEREFSLEREQGQWLQLYSRLREARAQIASPLVTHV